MAKRPGGALATRPLHFVWIVDASGSMSVDGKMDALNAAVREAIPHMRRVAEDNPNATVLMRCLRFSHGASWHVDEPVSVDRFEWRDIEADELVGGSGTPRVDVVFLIDTSGSMSDEIDSVKENCQAFANHIIKEGADIRVGLIGFDIGGHRGSGATNYTVHNLSRYTIGVWPITDPRSFKNNIDSLTLCLFGGVGCYIANNDTVDIFPHVINAFDRNSDNQRVLVIISDEIGDTSGLSQIVKHLKDAEIKTHVLGVPKKNGAHIQIAEQTGGQFWDITSSKGRTSFDGILEKVASTIAKEATKKLGDGIVSQGTDMGIALEYAAAEMAMPPMPSRALPPVLVLISDGQPTDDFNAGLDKLLAEPWGKKAVRIAIGIGEDADLGVLQRFIGKSDLKPLKANNPKALVEYVRWASTAAVNTASSPVANEGGKAPLIVAPESKAGDEDIW